MNKMKVRLMAALLAACAAGPAAADDLVFELVNATNSVLTHFYTSPVGVSDWESDVFGNQVLNPGETIRLTISDGRAVCDYDMKFVFEGSETLDTTTDTQDLCELGTYTIEE